MVIYQRKFIVRFSRHVKFGKSKDGGTIWDRAEWIVYYKCGTFSVLVSGNNTVRVIKETQFTTIPNTIIYHIPALHTNTNCFLKKIFTKNKKGPRHVRWIRTYLGLCTEYLEKWRRWQFTVKWRIYKTNIMRHTHTHTHTHTHAHTYTRKPSSHEHTIFSGYIISTPQE